MSRFLVGLRKLSLLSPIPQRDEAPQLADSSVPPPDLWFDRFRSHPQLLEVGCDVPTRRRVRFALEPGRKVIGEMPRGLTCFLLNLNGGDVEPAGLNWQLFGGPVQRLGFVAGEPLQPRVEGGTRMRLSWNKTELPRVRIRGVRWAQEGAAARSVPMGPSWTISSVERRWVIPDDWLATELIELRLTPECDGVQGLTESLILPPRRPRVETVFQRVMLPAHGSTWRRLRVEVRAPPPLTPPSTVVVEWRPRDVGVEPATFRADWPPGARTVTVDLADISMRGDLVRVRFELSAAPDQQFAWFHADESGHGPPTVDVLLAEGDRQVAAEYEYTHTCRSPVGEPAALLASAEPLPGVPALGASANGWPTTVAALYGDLSGDETLWAELRHHVPTTAEGLEEFVRVPQTYLLYDREPLLRVLDRLWGSPTQRTTIGHLLRAWFQQGLPADYRSLATHWAAADDVELDRWLEAAAAGGDISRLRTFWVEQRWKDVGAWQVLECSYQLDRVRAEPLAALLPEIVADGPLASELRHAVEQEQRLPLVNPTEFARTGLKRELVLSALAEHWLGLLPTDADERCRRIAERLKSEPSTAAQDLAALRQEPGQARLRCSRSPLFEVERVLAAAGRQLQHDRRLLLRAVADWYRMLLERRVLPVWPWYGLLPPDQTTATVRALWDSIRPLFPRTEAPPPTSLMNKLTQLEALAADLDDKELSAVAASARTHAASLAGWIQ